MLRGSEGVAKLCYMDISYFISHEHISPVHLVRRCAIQCSTKINYFHLGLKTFFDSFSLILKFIIKMK